MKRVMVSLALLLVSGGGMANNHTENRQFIHEQLQLDRQRSRPVRWHRRSSRFSTRRHSSSGNPCSPGNAR